ncbi:hypothetical protein D3C85_752200 [compost metagenome]
MHGAIGLAFGYAGKRLDAAADFEQAHPGKVLLNEAAHGMAVRNGEHPAIELVQAFQNVLRTADHQHVAATEIGPGEAEEFVALRRRDQGRRQIGLAIAQAVEKSPDADGILDLEFQAGFLPDQLQQVRRYAAKALLRIEEGQRLEGAVHHQPGRPVLLQPEPLPLGQLQLRILEEHPRPATPTTQDPDPLGLGEGGDGAVEEAPQPPALRRQ